MKRNLIVAEWRRADESLRAAGLLAEKGYHADAVSRAYYAALHGAKAALFVEGVTAESHAGVRRMFALHLIRTGEIESEWSAHLSEGLDDRLAADYDAELSFSKEEALQECRRSRDFLDRIRKHLLKKGFSDKELQISGRQD